MIRKSFNHDWTFQIGSAGSFALLTGGPSGAKKVTLPHDASIGRERNPEEPNGSGNGFFREENYVYTKEFDLDAELKDKNVWIEFEGIYQNASVYVNNAFVGSHPYGYGNVCYDLTKYVKFGGKNQIRVQVKNGVPSGRWYTGGGIYRDVSLMIADRLHIVPDGVRLATTELDGEYATVRVDTTVANKGLGTRSMKLLVRLIDAQGHVAAENRMPLTIFEGEEHSFRQWLTVEKPQTWDADHPYLYTYEARLLDGDSVVDEETDTFGIRRISLDVKRGLRINGKPVKLAGGCLHHDNGIIGTAEFPYAEEYRVKKLKEGGFNALRSSHYPMSRALIRACDKYGMYVMDEFADVWTSTKVDFDYGMNMPEWWKFDVQMQVRKDYNHPSVILYSIGNEIPETGNKIDTAAWGKSLSDTYRALDDTRFVVDSMNLMLSVMDRLPEIMADLKAKAASAGAADGSREGDGDPESSKQDDGKQMQAGEINETMSSLGDMMSAVIGSEITTKATEEAGAQVDVMGYNYAYFRYEPDMARYPNRIIMGSETYPRDLDANWALVEKYPQVIGDFDWTCWDYLGEAGIGKTRYGRQKGFGFYAEYPTKAAYCGDFDLLGDKRPVQLWRETIWGIRKAPYIAVQPPQHHGEDQVYNGWILSNAVRSWNFSGYEGKAVKVEVYADAEEVELKVNGASAGRAKVGLEKKNIAYFETIYQPGKVEAVAYRAGQIVGQDILATAGAPAVMEAVTDRTVIPADESDICYVELTVKDEKGRVNPEVQVPVTVSVEGAGVLLGYGSADPDSEENYFDTTAKTFNGRLRAAIRGNGSTGDIRVTFSAEEMKPAVVDLRAE